MNCLTVVTVLVAGLCVAVGGTSPIRVIRNCACSRRYFPVCGHDGQDYDNPSCAKSCGHVGYRVGTCASLEPCACPLSIQPVCARTPDGTVRSFDNECQATCQNSATIINQGECAAGVEQPIYRPGGQERHQATNTGVREKKQYSRCICTQEFVPVCGLKAGKWTTYGNQCAANCADVERSKPGACGTGGGCACSRIYRPVCGSLDGTLKTYPNRCVADCQEAVTVSEGPCAAAPDNSLPSKAKKSAIETGLPCVCTQEYVPVCGFNNGQWTQYPNRCTAKCSNAEPILNRPCNAPAQLPVFPDDKVPAQLPVFPDDKYPAQLPVFPDDRYPAQLPVFPGDSDDSDESDEDLVASQLPVFPRVLRKIFQ